MKQLYLAEKESAAQAIIDTLWPGERFPSMKRDGYVEKDGIAVTWAQGHILGLAEPDAYDPKFKTWSNYNIFPSVWKLRVSANGKRRFDIIKKLLPQAESVVNAGDSDREGQLLIDEILTYLKYEGKTDRILITSYDPVNMKRILAGIQSNDLPKFKNLSQAGLARERADWLVGMNLSRAFTKAASRFGWDITFTIGRVKVPTLALVVRREEELRNFKSKEYYELYGSFRKDGCAFRARFVPGDDFPTDPEGRILEKKLLEPVRALCGGKEGRVKDVKTTTKTENPPLPFSLDKLQSLANKKFKYSTSDVLDIAQKLYEAKLTTYPRSDCNYIPTAQFGDASVILSHLADLGVAGADKADPSLKGKAFNDKKISVHHAIIPTTVKPEGLSDREMNVYRLIAERYILQFYPPCVSKEVSFDINVEGKTFHGTGKTVISEGFRGVSSVPADTAGAEKDTNGKLPPLSKDEVVSSTAFDLMTRTTKPPKRYTDATLLDAMVSIWKYLSPDNPNREKLKECKGIGTQATRSTIIHELLADTPKTKGRTAFMETNKKGEILPTSFGEFFIHNIDESLTLPDRTAEMEYELSEIADGKRSLPDFMKNTEDMVRENIAWAENHTFPAPEGRDSYPCPICHKGFLMARKSKKTGTPFWICSDRDCVSPVTGKPVFYTDKGGKPVVVICPSCHEHPLERLPLKKGGYCWLCPKCRIFYDDDNGKPDPTPKKKAEPPKRTEDSVDCPFCHEGFLIRRIAKKSGRPFWICSKRDCISPVTEKPFFYDDAAPDGKKPLVVMCPKCRDYPLSHLHKKDGTFVFKCDKCGSFFDDKDGKPDTTPKKKAEPPKRTKDSVDCPFCHKGFLIRRIAKKTGKPFWICSEKDCVSPATGKPVFYSDDNGKPVVETCPACGHPLSRLLSKKTARYFWLCPKCNDFINDKDGKPDFSGTKHSGGTGRGKNYAGGRSKRR